MNMNATKLKNRYYKLQYTIVAMCISAIEISTVYKIFQENLDGDTVGNPFASKPAFACGIEQCVWYLQRPNSVLESLISISLYDHFFNVCQLPSEFLK